MDGTLLILDFEGTFATVDHSGKNCTLVPLVNFGHLIILGEEPRQPGSEVKAT